MGHLARARSAAITSEFAAHLTAASEIPEECLVRSSPAPATDHWDVRTTQRVRRGKAGSAHEVELAPRVICTLISASFSHGAWERLPNLETFPLRQLSTDIRQSIALQLKRI